MEKRCVVIGAASIRNYRKIRTFIRPDDFIIACDAGRFHSKKLKVAPSLLVGDFDSSKNPHLKNIETIILPHEKDDTDSFYAVKEACSRGFNSFLLIGFTGDRLDHTLCNTSILLYLESRKIPAVIVDDYSEMEIVSPSRSPVYVNDSYSYFSLLNIEGNVQGVTIQNAKYNIENKDISSEVQFASSNEVPKGNTASISIRQGRLLLIKVW